MKTRFEFNRLDNGNWNAIDTQGGRVLIAVNVTQEAAEKACDKRADTPQESERQILRCAPPFDSQAEHENDLRQESLHEFYGQEAE